MSKRFIQKRSLLALMLALCVCLSGCSALLAVEPESEGVGRAELPLPDTETPDPPLGDGRAGSIRHATLYYFSADMSRLFPVSRALYATDEQSLAEKLVEEVLKAPEEPETAAFAPEGTRLSYIERSMNTVTVNLLPGAALSGGEAQARVASAVASTLLETNHAEYVNVLWAGRALSCGQTPVGALGGGVCDYNKLIARASDDATVTRYATLYYPSADGNYMVPETRAVSFSGENIADRLIAALADAPGSEGLLAGMPIRDGLLAQESKNAYTEGGELVADVYFTLDAYRALEASAVRRWQFLAALALTIPTFSPNTDGVRVYINDYLITEVEGPDGSTMRFEGGVLRRDDFAGEIGAQAALFFEDADGGLSLEYRAVRLTEADSLRARIAMLMAGPSEEGLLPTFPDGLNASDILGVTVENGVARVNFSTEFYRLCQPLSTREEECLIYSLVNTLCGDRAIRGVRLYIGGMSVDTLAGGIWLRGVLLPNPGRM